MLSGGPGNDILHTSDFPQAGCSLYGDEGDDVLFVWTDGLAIGSQAFADGGNGNDTIYQFTGDAAINGGHGNDLIVDWDDGGLQNETITMTGANGNDTLVSEDASSTVNMDGGKGFDFCADGDATVACELVI